MFTSLPKSQTERQWVYILDTQIAFSTIVEAKYLKGKFYCHVGSSHFNEDNLYSSIRHANRPTWSKQSPMEILFSSGSRLKQVAKTNRHRAHATKARKYGKELHRYLCR